MGVHVEVLHQTRVQYDQYSTAQQRIRRSIAQPGETPHSCCASFIHEFHVMLYADTGGTDNQYSTPVNPSRSVVYYSERNLTKESRSESIFDFLVYKRGACFDPRILFRDFVP